MRTCFTRKAIHTTSAQRTQIDCRAALAMTTCEFWWFEPAPRHCERRFTSEAIHTTSAQQTQMDCRAALAMTRCEFWWFEPALRHCERRFTSEAIHTASAQQTQMDYHSSIKPFKGHNRSINDLLIACPVHQLHGFNLTFTCL